MRFKGGIMYYIADSESGIKEFSSILNNNHFNADPRYNYAWKNPVLAILKDCIVSGDDPKILVDEKNGIADVWECTQGAFVEVLREKTVSLYVVDDSDFIDDLTGWEAQSICTHEVSVVTEKTIDNLYGMLLDYEIDGMCELHYYSEDKAYLHDLDYVVDHIAERDEKPILVIENGVLVRLDGYDWHQEIIIPDGVESIGCRAFHERNVFKVVISNGVKNIEPEAFLECSVSEVVIPDSVTFIGEWAFGECENLKEITIPESLEEIEPRAIGFYHDRLYMEQPYNHEIVIYGKTGSAAEQYVKTNGGYSNQHLRFVNISVAVDGTVYEEDTSDGTVYEDDTSDETVYEDDTSDGTVYEDEASDGTVYEDETTDGTVYEDETSDGTVNEEAAGEKTGDSFDTGGLLLNTYRIDSNAIQGGMGTIRRVHHMSWDTDLAMKRPKKEFFVTEKQKDAFIHECDAWINLGLHPNIVSCYYVREIDEVPTIFSEWMDGGSLEGKIRDGSLYKGTDAEVGKRLLDIAIQFARGLNVAHERGLIHQDVKPDNLLLTNDWDAKVSDFGLAKARSMITILEGDWTVREDDPFGTIVTPSGGMTPSYCSPEQAASQPLTRRTDIYSWAVSVLEMYIGDRPWFQGRELTGPVVSVACDTYFEMCRVPMPDRLRSLLARCLAYNPDDRYHDFSRVEASLKEIYRMETGEEYPRPLPEAASDTADSLNNRALSFIDLGKTDDALKIWDEAIRVDNRNFRCHYNRAVTLWKNNRINADELYAAVMEREEESSDWEKASEAVSFAKVVMESDIKAKLIKDIRAENPAKNTFTREDFYAQAPKSGVELPEEPIYTFEMAYSYWQEKVADSDGVYDQSRDGKRTISYDSKTEEYVVREENKEYRFRNTPIGRVGGGWKFVDKSGGILSTHNFDVHFISAVTGRSLLIFHADRDWDDDVIFEHITRCSDNGFVELEKSDTMRSKRWLKLPPSDPKVDYILSRIESFAERKDALEQLKRDYYEALRFMEEDEYEEVLSILSPFAENGALLQLEPALRLWEKLFNYCEPGKLITVIPSEEHWRPVQYDSDVVHREAPEGFDWELNVYEGDSFYLTAIEKYTMSDNYHDTIDYDFTYSLKAEDFESGRIIFTVDKLTSDSQDDENVIDYGLWMILDGNKLWYKKKDWPDSGNVNLETPEFQRKAGLRITLPGTGEYFLRNTDNGVEIGGFLFDDEFCGLIPLLDKQIVQCRNRAYRLIYQYTGIR